MTGILDSGNGVHNPNEPTEIPMIPTKQMSNPDPQNFSILETVNGTFVVQRQVVRWRSHWLFWQKEDGTEWRPLTSRGYVFRFGLSLELPHEYATVRMARAAAKRFIRGPIVHSVIEEKK